MRHCNFLTLLPLLLAGCNPHVVIEQPKPLEININFKGELNLVIHDAKADLEKITGEKPTHEVRLEDIGLAPKAGGALTPMEKRLLAENPQEKWTPALLSNRHETTAARGFVYVALADDLKKAMAARNSAIRALWDAKLVGEGHNGLLAARGTLTADQKKQLDAENADRTALYAAEAKEKGISADDVAFGYFVARLGYAKNGAWFEKKNTAGQWEWKQWGM